MDNDIVPTLLETISKDFDEQTFSSLKLKKALVMLKNQQATYIDVNDFAIETGEILANVLSINITSAALPDGKMHYNIADRILNPTMKKNHALISSYAVDVQTNLNHAAGLRIKAQKPELNQNRIDGLVNKISNSEEFDDVKWLLDEPMINFSQSIVDDSIKSNINFHAKAGLRPKLTRTVSGHACDWCLNLAGSYNYDEAPDDVYRRHERCRCKVEYDPRNGKRQNVWLKSWEDPEKGAKIESRKQIGLDPANELSKKAKMALNKTNMQSQVGNEHYSNFLKHLDSVENKRVKEMFSSLGDQIDFKEIKNDGRAYAQRGSVQLSHSSFEGDKISKPFETIYHELGHAFDSFGIERLTGKERVSTGKTYKQKVLGKMIDFDINATHASGLPQYSLSSTIKDDLWKYINGDLPTYESLGNRPRKKAEKIAWDAENNRVYTEWNKNKKAFLEKYKVLTRENPQKYASLSDMMESTGYFDSYPLGVGHGEKYWKSYGKAETEFFAHMTELVANKESAEVMSEIFPNSTKVWEQIVDDILRKVK